MLGRRRSGSVVVLVEVEVEVEMEAIFVFVVDGGEVDVVMIVSDSGS